MKHAWLPLATTEVVSWVTTGIARILTWWFRSGIPALAETRLCSGPGCPSVSLAQIGRPSTGWPTQTSRLRNLELALQRCPPKPPTQRWRPLTRPSIAICAAAVSTSPRRAVALAAWRQQSPALALTGHEAHQVSHASPRWFAHRSALRACLGQTFFGTPDPCRGG